MKIGRLIRVVTMGMVVAVPAATASAQGDAPKQTLTTNVLPVPAVVQLRAVQHPLARAERRPRVRVQPVRRGAVARAYASPPRDNGATPPLPVGAWPDAGKLHRW